MSKKKDKKGGKKEAPAQPKAEVQSIDSPKLQAEVTPAVVSETVKVAEAPAPELVVSETVKVTEAPAPELVVSETVKVAEAPAPEPVVSETVKVVEAPAPEPAIAEITAEETPELQGEAPPPPVAAKEAPAGGVSASLVKELREKTGAGMMDCKKALQQNSADLHKAIEWLRKKGIASAGNKAKRVASEGLVGSYIHTGGRVGVLVEVNCETDFVARGDEFKELVHNMAMQIAACPNVEYISTNDIDPDFVAREKDIEMGRDDLANKPENVREKIVQGRIEKRLKEVSLMDQPYIRDQSITVGELVTQTVAKVGENIQVRRFSRFVLGEGIEKKESNFAEEVAAQAGLK